MARPAARRPARRRPWPTATCRRRSPRSLRPLPAARPRLAAVPRPRRPRRMPGRRHGPRQDADDARPPRRRAPGPHLVVCPLSVVRNWQREAARFTPLLRGARAPRRRPRPRATTARRRDRRSTTSSITTYQLLRPRPRRRSAARRLGHGRARRGAGDQERRHTQAARAVPAPAGRAAASRSPARRSRTGSASCGRSSTCRPRACSGSRAQFQERFAHADRARARRRGGRGAAHAHVAVRPPPHEGRQAPGARPARQDRADRLGAADPRAGGDVPGRRRPAAERRRSRPRACAAAAWCSPRSPG